jgi:CheY-like chemotaxis protein
MPKILLVEDNPENWDMLSRRLRRRGFDVVIATDGEQGLAMARSEAPDLVLMDMNLPKIDGWEATRRIRATPDLAALPIIALTAHESGVDREKTLEAGCNLHHAKPVELSTLLGQIESLLKK